MFVQVRTSRSAVAIGIVGAAQATGIASVRGSDVAAEAELANTMIGVGVTTIVDDATTSAETAITTHEMTEAVIATGASDITI